MVRARVLVGLLLVGYGLLILSRVLAHESVWAGLVSVVLGALLVRTGLPALSLRRARLVAALGGAIVVLVLGYNAVRGSDLTIPEWSLVAYGASLMAAAPFLSRSFRRIEVGALVAWSFPLVLAPLAVYALNASLSSSASGAAAAPMVLVLIVWPTVAMLNVLGTDAAIMGDSVVLGTERGSLVLDIGIVCAGIYPMILFSGILALHAWRVGLARPDVARLLAAGIAGLWFVNVLRLVALARIGVEWGPGVLTDTHANLGWLLFGAFMFAFCLLFLRGSRPQGTPTLSASSIPGALVPPAGTAGSGPPAALKRL
jgi:exosortase/archaeosortase family protein